MIKQYLQAVKNKCRCGATAQGIKEVTQTSRGKITSQRIVTSKCAACGLKFVAEDMKGRLNPFTQDLIIDNSI